MKIDIFCHIFPKSFSDRMLAMSERAAYMQKRVREIPVMTDLDLRFRVMDQFPGYQQVFCLASPPLEVIGDPKTSPDRAIRQLGARGVQIFSNVNGRPLDEPEFRPLFERMAAHDLPIWMHPSRPVTFADYPVEKKSKYEMWWVFGWPYETSIAMARIAFTGIFDAFPNLKIITHHTGGMAPYF